MVSKDQFHRFNEGLIVHCIMSMNSFNPNSLGSSLMNAIALLMRGIRLLKISELYLFTIINEVILMSQFLLFELVIEHRTTSNVQGCALHIHSVVVSILDYIGSRAWEAISSEDSRDSLFHQ